MNIFLNKIKLKFLWFRDYCTLIPWILTKRKTMYIYTSGSGPLLGLTQGLEKTLHTENKQKNKIEDAHNGTKIGASNIFGGNQLRFQISAQ